MSSMMESWVIAAEIVPAELRDECGCKHCPGPDAHPRPELIGLSMVVCVEVHPARLWDEFKKIPFVVDEPLVKGGLSRFRAQEGFFADAESAYEAWHKMYGLKKKGREEGT